MMVSTQVKRCGPIEGSLYRNGASSTHWITYHITYIKKQQSTQVSHSYCELATV